MSKETLIEKIEAADLNVEAVERLNQVVDAEIVRVHIEVSGISLRETVWEDMQRHMQTQGRAHHSTDIDSLALETVAIVIELIIENIETASLRDVFKMLEYLSAFPPELGGEFTVFTKQLDIPRLEELRIKLVEKLLQEGKFRGDIFEDLFVRVSGQPLQTLPLMQFFRRKFLRKLLKDLKST